MERGCSSTGVGLEAGRRRRRNSTRAATAVVPLAILHLAVGTIALLTGMTGVQVVPRATVIGVVHSYAVGFAALSIVSLGARLLVGFYHVSPRPRTWDALCGGAAPALIAVRFWMWPLLQVGAVVRAFGMLCYLGMMAVVAVRTDRRRIGLVGVLLGAFAEVRGVLVAATVAIGGGAGRLLEAHVPLGVGVVLRATEPLLRAPVIGDVGATLGIVATCVYAYVLTRRLTGIHAG